MTELSKHVKDTAGCDYSLQLHKHSYLMRKQDYAGVSMHARATFFKNKIHNAAGPWLQAFLFLLWLSVEVGLCQQIAPTAARTYSFVSLNKVFPISCQATDTGAALR